MTLDKVKFGLEKKEIRTIQNILAYYPTVLKVMVFGSRAKGNYRNKSDLDLVIIGSGQDKVSSISGDIGESDFLYSVDVIGYDSTNDNILLKSEIDKYGVEFWLRNEKLIDQTIFLNSKKDPFWERWKINILKN